MKVIQNEIKDEKEKVRVSPSGQFIFTWEPSRGLVYTWRSCECDQSPHASGCQESTTPFTTSGNSWGAYDSNTSAR